MQKRIKTQFGSYEKPMDVTQNGLI